MIERDVTNDLDALQERDEVSVVFGGHSMVRGAMKPSPYRPGALWVEYAAGRWMNPVDEVVLNNARIILTARHGVPEPSTKRGAVVSGPGWIAARLPGMDLHDDEPWSVTTLASSGPYGPLPDPYYEWCSWERIVQHYPGPITFHFEGVNDDDIRIEKEGA